MAFQRREKLLHTRHVHGLLLHLAATHLDQAEEHHVAQPPLIKAIISVAQAFNPVTKR